MWYVLWYILYGHKIKIDNKWYFENGIRFAKTTQQSKERFSMCCKLELHYGLPKMKQTTWKRYRAVVDDKNNDLAQTYMKEARDEMKNDQAEGFSTMAGSDTSWSSTAGGGYNAISGQNTTIGKVKKVDPRTNKNSKVIANSVQDKRENYSGSSGHMEVVGMIDCLQQCFDDGLEIDILTKDCDSESKNALKKFNNEHQTNTFKADDSNHKDKAMSRSLDGKNAKNGKKIRKHTKKIHNLDCKCT